MKIAVIDYGLGNLASVYNALKSLGGKPKITESPKDLLSSDKIVLPGVGAFQDGMKGLTERGLSDAIKKSIEKGKPYLGICLGLQLLFEKSEEGGPEGLSIFKGRVKRFDESKGIKVPHIGWNTVDQKKDTKRPKLLSGIETGDYFYFDHSYYGSPQDENVILARTPYGDNFGSILGRDNIFAVQFHPERSQRIGLKMLKNFIEG